MRFFYRIADLWTARYAHPSKEALAAVASKKPAVVVTGGSRGFGFALARRFAEAGSTVAIIARGQGPLEAAANAIEESCGSRPLAIALDVTQPDAPAEIEAALERVGLYCDVLVNNAGVGLAGSFVDDKQENLEWLVSLNVSALQRLMRHALPQMLERGRGGILNIASLGGMTPGPYQAAYYASKAFVLSLTEAIGHEVRGRGVRISAVAPGPLETDFHRTMGAEGSLYRELIPSTKPEAAARSAYRGYQLGRRVIVPGVLGTLAAIALRILPHSITLHIVGTILKPPRR